MSLYTCTTPGCRHRDEWCNRNRKHCDRLIDAGKAPNGSNLARACGKRTIWLAPLDSSAFPLAYCAEHAPPVDDL